MDGLLTTKKTTQPYRWVNNRLQLLKTKLPNINDRNMGLTFLKAFINNPLATGSITPSSKFLANEMAAHVSQTNNGIIVELGAGTGAITESLLESGIDPNDLIIIEYSKELVNKLKERFPHVMIIEGSAANLKKLLSNEIRAVSTIVSSLPLKSLPRTVTTSILKQINEVLQDGGKYIQYTYSFGQFNTDNSNNYKHKLSKRIWRNLPPARVDVLIKNDIAKMTG